jgi:hypothetical protein
MLVNEQKKKENNCSELHSSKHQRFITLVHDRTRNFNGESCFLSWVITSCGNGLCYQYIGKIDSLCLKGKVTYLQPGASSCNPRQCGELVSVCCIVTLPWKQNQVPQILANHHNTGLSFKNRNSISYISYESPRAIVTHSRNICAVLKWDSELLSIYMGV